MVTTIYQIAAGLLYFSQFFGIVYFNKRSSVHNVIYDEREPTAIIIIRALWAFMVVGVICIYILNPVILDFAHIHLPNAIRITGIGLGIVVDTGIFWILLSLKRNISTTLAVSENHKLVTHGPYKYVRHPMYSFGVVLFLALMLISANWLIGIAGIGFQLFIMIIRTPLEEKMMEKHFKGEYRSYKMKTGKFFPKWGNR